MNRKERQGRRGRRLRWGAALAVVVIAGLVVACSSSDISAEDYDASCSADGDCVPATFGDVCTLSCNPNGAILRTEEARYLADLQAKLADCPTVNYFQDPCAGAHRTIVAQCVAGRCEAVDVTDNQEDAGADGAP